MKQTGRAGPAFEPMFHSEGTHAKAQRIATAAGFVPHPEDVLRLMRELSSDAVTRRDIRFVTIKSAEQQSLQSVHRMRERLIQERTAKSNQIRSMFAEEGIVFPTGLPQLRKGIVLLIDDADARITPLLRRLGSMYLEQMTTVQQWLDEINTEIAEIFKRDEVCQQLATVPGIGPVIATALVGSVGDSAAGRRGSAASRSGATPICGP